MSASENVPPENLPEEVKPPPKLHEIWDGAADAAHLLGMKINKSVDENGEGYHKMALIPPGGFPAALVLMGPFGFTAHDVFNMNVTREKSGELKVTNPPSINDVEGLNILLIDDFWRTGKLLTCAREILIKRRARRVDIAVLHAITSDEEGVLQPNFYALPADQDGVSYPWDRQSVRFEPLRPIRIPSIAEVIAVQEASQTLLTDTQQ